MKAATVEDTTGKESKETRAHTIRDQHLVCFHAWKSIRCAREA